MSEATAPPQTQPLSARLRQIWAYAQHELLYVSWGLMEIALFTPIVFSFMGWTRYWPPGQIVLWLLLIMLLPFNLARLMSLFSIPTQRQQTIMAGALFLTIAVSTRTLIYSPQSMWDVSWIGDFFANLAESGNQLWLRDIGVFFVIVVIWWRGLRLINRQFDIKQVGFRLRLGVLIAPFAIWLGSVSLSWNVTWFVLLYFLAGLTALALVRAEQIEKAQSGFSTSLSPRWLAVIFAASLLTVSSAGVLAAMISGKSLFAAAGFLAPLMGALTFGATVITRTLAYLGTPLFNALARLIDWLALILQNLFSRYWTEPQLQPTVDLGQAVTETATEVVDVAAPPDFNSRILAILLMIAVILLVSLALGRLYRMATFAARESEPIGRQRPEVDTEMGLGRRLLNRLGLWRNWRTAVSIRRIYAQMLKTAAAAGYPRAEAETPYEYLNTLAQAWPENSSDYQLLTQAYVNVRYGEIPETEAELEALEEAWRRLQAAEPVTLEAPHLEKRL